MNLTGGTRVLISAEVKALHLLVHVRNPLGIDKVKRHRFECTYNNIKKYNMQKVEYQIGINYDCSPIIITHYIPEKKVKFPVIKENISPSKKGSERKRVNSSSHNQ